MATRTASATLAIRLPSPVDGQGATGRLTGCRDRRRRRGFRALTILALCLATLSPAAAATLSVPGSLTGAVGGQTVVPVTLDPAVGLESATFTLSYDPALLTAIAAYTTDVTEGFSLSYDVLTPGIVSIELSGPAVASIDAEPILWLAFHALGPAGSASDLTWTQATLNAGAIPAVTVDGSVGAESAVTTVSIADNVQGSPGSQVLVPFSVDQVTGSESFDLIVRYNPALLDAFNVIKAPLMQSMFLTFSTTTPGEVRISMFAVQPVSGSGQIVGVEFDVIGSLGRRTPMDITKAVINESAIPTVIDDGLFTLCDNADVDGDGFNDCADDCDDGDAMVRPDADETCDGRDTNCDGAVDNAPTPSEAPLLLMDSLTDISWSAVTDATGYDLLRGTLQALQASGGAFSAVPIDCLADEQGATTFTDATPPPPIPEVFWYLSRGTNCGGGGTYDSGGPLQTTTRDPSIAAAILPCP